MLLRVVWNVTVHCLGRNRSSHAVPCISNHGILILMLVWWVRTTVVPLRMILWLVLLLSHRAVTMLLASCVIQGR